MKTATVKFNGVSPYQQGRYHNLPRLEDGKEGHDEYAQRTWREQVHADADGNIFIPPMAFKNCLSTAAAFLSIPIPGKSRQTYTKNFVAGILVLDPVYIGKKKEDAIRADIFGDSQGKRGGKTGSRKMIYLPLFTEWEGTVVFHIVDGTISKEIFERVLRESGKFIGVGVYRPQNGGYYGRFDVESIDWSEDE